MAMTDFQQALNQYINQNNNQGGSNFKPVSISRKHPFFGRILPVSANAWPFAMYNNVWVSYTNKSGQVTPLSFNIDPQDPNDKLGKLISNVISFNRQYSKQHRDFVDQNGNPKEAIQIAYGKFGLNINHRATFYGVTVEKTQDGRYAQALNPEGQLDIKAYDISNGALNEIASLLQPKIPYMKQNGQPMFNNAMQFITAQETYPISLSFEKQGTSQRGSWKGEVISQLVLPAITYNYMEKDQLGNYKYVPDIFTEQQPLYKREPSFADTVYDQLSQSVKQQKEQLAQSQTNPYATGFNDTGVNANQMPFPPTQSGQKVDVVQNMTGQPAGNFKSAPQAPITNNNPIPQQTPAQQQPQAPVNQPTQNTTQPQQPQQPVQSQAPVQPTQASVQSNVKTTPQQAPATSQEPVNNAPVQPQAPTSQQAPVAPQSQSAPQPNQPTSQVNSDEDNLDIDSILNGDKSLGDFLSDNQ